MSINNDDSISVLYYSNALLASHGGKLHSEAFIREAQNSVRVRKILLYPTPSDIPPKHSDLKERLRSILKTVPIFQLLFFFRRNRRSMKEIGSVLERFAVDSLHIRLDSNFLIVRRLRALYPHLIITTEVNASPFDENFQNIPFVAVFRRVERNSLQCADANFFVSRFLRDRIMEHPKDSRDYVVHNGVDLELFKAERVRNESGDITFCYVGTMERHKHVELLIDAFALLLKSAPAAARLLLIGDGPQFNELEDYIQSKRLNSFIRLTGRVEHRDIPKYLREADIAVHHSANAYMSPLKIFEYMASGLPVIAPDTPAIREIFTDGLDVLMVREEVTDITDKMLMLMVDRQKRESIAAHGNQKVREKFGWAHNAEAILSVIQEIKRSRVNRSLEGRRPRGASSSDVK